MMSSFLCGGGLLVQIHPEAEQDVVRVERMPVGKTQSASQLERVAAAIFGHFHDLATLGSVRCVRRLMCTRSAIKRSMTVREAESGPGAD
jgi:hypothetical protein